jgi:hypothetical protein
MAAQQSFWRYHNKPRSSRPRRVIAHIPDPGTREYFRQLMRMAVETAIASGLQRPQFPFEPSDVVEVHTKHLGEPGLWFRLHDGRVFSRTGAPESANSDDYESAV